MPLLQIVRLALLPATGGCATVMVVDPVRVCVQLGGFIKVTLTSPKVDVIVRGILNITVPDGPILMFAVVVELIVYVTVELGVPANKTEAVVPEHTVPLDEIVAIGKGLIITVPDALALGHVVVRFVIMTL